MQHRPTGRRGTSRPNRNPFLSPPDCHKASCCDTIGLEII
jgi:hypothetical protein